MDYTAEADALHGSSPWGSSSPRASRNFPQNAPDSSPDSPQPVRGHSYNQSQDSIPESPYLPPPGQSATSVPGEGRIGGEGSQGLQPAEGSEHPQAAAIHHPQNQVQQPGQQYSEQPQQRPGAARYHGTRQSRPVPQYKLQAKVTALERTGRKDPVIRFDVYVCTPVLEDETMLTAICRPISPSSAPHSSVTSAEHMENSSSSLTT
jgi:hypothetical protein